VKGLIAFQTGEQNMCFRNLVLIGTLAAGTATMASAQVNSNSLTRQSNFAPVGVAGTETIQVNLLNTAQNNTNNGTAASCTGSVAFLDSAGKAISGAGGSFTVPAGQIVSVSLAGSKIPASSTTGTRPEVHITVSLVTTVPHPAPCALVESLETFDSTTGATHTVQASTVPAVQFLGATLAPGLN
jgi:hypothetical protein